MSEGNNDSLVALPREVVEQVLAAMQRAGEQRGSTAAEVGAMEALRAALEQPQSKQDPPIAHLHLDQWMQLKLVQTTPPPPGAFPVYTRQQSTRQPLTDEQWLKLWTGKTGQRLKPGLDRDRLLRRFRFAERAHGIGS